MWPNPQKTANLVAFTEEILKGKLQFLCGALCPWKRMFLDVFIFSEFQVFCICVLFISTNLINLTLLCIMSQNGQAHFKNYALKD